MNTRAIWFCFGWWRPRQEDDKGARLIDLPFAKTWDPGCKFMYLHIKGRRRELRAVIRDLRLAVYVILQGWCGEVYVFTGATASARGLKGLEVNWRWLYSCCNPSALGVPCQHTGVKFGEQTARS